MSADTIPALLPRGTGHQFVCYADGCSGVPNGRHEATFASVNAVVRRLRPHPEFVCFPGDEIIGLTADDELRRQWRYWLDREMAWLDRTAIPLTTPPAITRPTTRPAKWSCVQNCSTTRSDSAQSSTTSAAPWSRDGHSRGPFEVE